MRNSEWPREYLETKEVFIKNNMVYVRSSRGTTTGLVSDSSIVNAQWVNDAVVVTYRNGQRVRYFGPYGSQRETL
jgi:hypothetical protein